MSKSADVFNLIESLLPRSDQLTVVVPSEMQRLYSGIGMPSLRVTDLAGNGSPLTYHQIKVANPLLNLTDPIRIRQHYGELREQAMHGDADALNDLGWLWLNGWSLKPDPLLAKRMFRIAAVLDSPEALFNLAEQAWYGKGVTVNPLLAIDYYEQAFASGIPCAAQALGTLYERGDGSVPADHGTAIVWYERGVVEGDAMAGFLLGRLALDEASTEHNQATGLYWLQWAAMSGVMLASERLADFYRSTFDSPPDPDGLLYRFWLDIAIKQGSSWAAEMSARDGARQLAVNR